jgi:hypothetical protein
MNQLPLKGKRAPFRVLEISGNFRFTRAVSAGGASGFSPGANFVCHFADKSSAKLVMNPAQSLPSVFRRGDPRHWSSLAPARTEIGVSSAGRPCANKHYLWLRG